uniref:Uncharacterized protein n=1 Tax=Meloidogyne enterolobii TaxID=390850 RepID=A0A6V7UNI1_MELEN|nr:unnamed protein product [Meloidogyne enterolobii]
MTRYLLEIIPNFTSNIYQYPSRILKLNKNFLIKYFSLIMNIFVRFSILLIISIVHARNTATNKIASALETRATLRKFCNNTLEDDKYLAERCDGAVSAAISILNNSCGIHKNVTKSHPAGYEGCELFFKSMGHFSYCKGPLFGATYTRCLNDPNIKCCKYIADTVTATVEPYCEIFSSSIANNRKEICSDKNTLCESIMNIEAEKAKQACYNIFGISVAEDVAPLEIFKS